LSLQKGIYIFLSRKEKTRVARAYTYAARRHTPV